MAGSQILKNTNAQLEVVFSAGDASGAVTITVTRADGTAIVTGGATVNETEAGRYTYVLAPQTELDQLTAVWSGTWGGVAQSLTTYAEIVGGVLYPLSDLRTFGDQVLADTTKYPDEALREARERHTDMFQDVCQTSFIPRYDREIIDGTNTNRLWLRRKRVTRLIACSVDGTAITGPSLTALKVYPTGRVERSTTWPVTSTTLQNVIVAYEYGWSSPPPDISRAAMILARYELVSSDISDRMVSFSNDLGEVRLSVPGNKYPTGIPIVDATLARYDETDPIPPY